MKDSQTKQVEQPAKNEPTPVRGDAEKLQLLMSLVRVGYQQAANEILEYCINNKVTPQFENMILEMLNEDNKKKFVYDLFKTELEKEQAAPKGDDVISKGKIIERWKTARTEATSWMLDNPQSHFIYPTSKFFEKIDAHFETLMEEYANQFKSAPQAVKWEQARERLPERNKQVHGKYKGRPGVVWDSNLIKGFVTFNGNLERVEDIEWLDEGSTDKNQTK